MKSINTWKENVTGLLVTSERLLNKRLVNLKTWQKKIKMNQKRKQRWYKWTERWENIKSFNRCIVGVPEEEEKEWEKKYKKKWWANFSIFDGNYKPTDPKTEQPQEA